MSIIFWYFQLENGFFWKYYFFLLLAHNCEHFKCHSSLLVPSLIAILILISHCHKFLEQPSWPSDNSTNVGYSIFEKKKSIRQVKTELASVSKFIQCSAVCFKNTSGHFYHTYIYILQSVLPAGLKYLIYPTT